MTFPDLSLLPFVLLAGLALPRRQEARLVAAGFLLASLAVASATLVLGDGAAADVAARGDGRGVHGSYFTVNAVLLLVAFGLAATALAGDLGDARPAWLAVVGVSILAAVWWAVPLLQRGRLLVAVPAAIAGVLLLLALATWSGERAPTGGAPLVAWRAQGRRAAGWGLAIAALLAMLVPNLGVALLLVAVALGLAWFAAPPRQGLARLPVPLVAAVAAAAVAGGAWRAAGADGLGLAGLADAAFSPRLQVLLTALLLPVLFVVAGVPPFDRMMPGAALAPVAAVLVAHAVVPGFPDGVFHWRSAAALWLVLGAADGVRRARSGPVVASVALFALLVGGWDAAVPGLVLASLAAALELAATWRAVPATVARVALGAGLVAWAVALRATLPEEVVYSVALVVVLAGGVLRGAGRPADDAPAAPAA
jgi:hypothetical protein